MQAHSYTAEETDEGRGEAGNGMPTVRDLAGKADARAKVTRALPRSVDTQVLTLAAARVRASQRQRMMLLAVRVALDAVLLVGAFIVAYWLRYTLSLGRDIVAVESFQPLSFFYGYIAAFVIIALVTFQSRGLYALPRGASWFDHLRLIVSGSLVAVAALTLGSLVLNPVLPSRGLFIYLWLSTLAIFAVERFIARRIRVWLWCRGINIRKALVVGSGLAGQRIIKDVLERADLGYSLVGYISDTRDAPSSESWQVPLRVRNGSGPKWLGSLRDIERVINQQPLHEVIVALPANHHAQILNIIDSCRQYGVDFKLVPDLFEMRFNEVRIDALNGVPLIGVKSLALQGFNLFIKRGLDILFAIGALIVAAIPMAIIALLIKATSPGPVLFKQQRVGKGGRQFTCYKFRSMVADAEQRLHELLPQSDVSGVMFKMKNDPRVTRVGKFLRRTSLDELPQMFNILKGEMSWVGPRPPTPREVEQYNEWHLKRLDVSPGLTGLWQVSGRSDLSFEDMVKLDIYYAENWSLAVDAMIILKTIPAVIRREGAY